MFGRIKRTVPPVITKLNLKCDAFLVVVFLGYCLRSSPKGFIRFELLYSLKLNLISEGAQNGETMSKYLDNLVNLDMQGKTATKEDNLPQLIHSIFTTMNDFNMWSRSKLYMALFISGRLPPFESKFHRSSLCWRGRPPAVYYETGNRPNLTKIEFMLGESCDIFTAEINASLYVDVGILNFASKINKIKMKKMLCE